MSGCQRAPVASIGIITNLGDQQSSGALPGDVGLP